MKVLLASLAFLLGVATAGAAEPTPPVGLVTASKALADAVAANDLNAVIGLSQFPLKIDVYQSPPKITRKAFGKDDLKMLFGDRDKGILACLRGGPFARNDPKTASTPIFGKSWSADCDGNSYYFAESEGRWLFIGYQNSNE
ncbi:hypothetical protein [Methylopila sp. M107]|uniref:hypothetical protein n=1 Tax=Methylopila sp. M107 TaxID=1101190 RepID=UPI00035C493B|nr:hypothetical protein [Methylopila sp. M107]